MADKEKSGLVSLEVETKQLEAAVKLVKTLEADWANLKKSGASLKVLADQEALIKEVAKAVDELMKTRQKADKEEKKAASDRLKESKDEIEQAKKLQKEAKQKERDDQKAAKEADKKAAADKKAQDIEQKAAEKREAAAQKEAKTREKEAAKAQKEADKKAAAERKVAEALEAENELLSRQADNIRELEQQNAILVKRRKQLSFTNEEDAKSFNELTAVIKANQERINSFNEDIGRHQGSVGDYLKVWEGLPGIAGQAGQAVGGLGEQMKGFISNPYAMVFAAIAAAVTTLFKAFLETSGGAEMMRKASAYLSAGWSQLRIIADSLADSLKNVSLSGAGFKQLGSDIFDGFVKKVTDPFKNWIGIVKSVFTLDFEGLGDKFKNLGVSLFDFFSPVSLENFKKLISGTADLAKKTNDLAKEYLDLNTIQRNLTFATMGYNEAIAKTQAELDLLQEKIGADSLSQKENEQAMKDAAIVAERLAAQKMGLARANLDAANAEVALGIKTKKSLDSMTESYQKQSEARIQVTEADNQYKDTLFKNREEISKRQMDWADLDLDILIDGYDNRKTIMERTAALETTTAAERAKLLSDFRAQEENNAAAAVETLQKFAKGKIDVNALMAIDDERVLKSRIKDLEITERMGLRLFEHIRERRTWNQDLTDVEINNAKLNEDAKKKQFDTALTTFQQEQALATLKFEAQKVSDAEKNAFELEQRKAMDEARLRLAQEAGIKMSETERLILEQQIANDTAAYESARKLAEGKMTLKEAETAAAMSALEFTKTAFGEESRLGKIAAKLQQALAMKKAILDFKGAILKAWNLPFPANIAAVATTVAGAAPLVASIASVKFARGGVLEGASHANGGIPVMGGHAEVEGGEYVVNKKSTSAFLPLLDSINSFQNWGDASGSSKSKFATGGILPSTDRQISQTSPNFVTEYVPVLVLDDLDDMQQSRAFVNSIIKG